MMLDFNAFTVGLIIIVCVIATVLTYRVLKEEEHKQKAYKESGQTIEDELQRSLEYETSSWSSNVPIMSWIYIVATVLSIIAFVIYMA